MPHELTAGSLFTGVGGLDLGLERAGVRVVFQCELDEWCRGILAQHWPGVPCYPDVRGVGLGRRDDGRADTGRSGNAADRDGHRWSVPRVDVLCGGSPCQDLSVAGLRRGLAGERSGLFFEFARCADELVRPGGWLIFENVPGLLNSQAGRDFAIVVRTLGDIGFHDLAWRVLDSRYLGVPQRRRRVFIVGRRAVGGSARQVLLEPESGGGDFAPGRQAGARVAACLSKGSSGSGVSAPGRRQEDDENIVASTLEAGIARRRHDEQANYVAGALTRRVGKGVDSDGADMPLIAHTLRAEGFDASEDGTGRGTPLVADTVRTHPRPGSNSDGALIYGATSDPNGVRAPSRLPRRVDDPRPDGPRYSAMGNAVTVNVAEWIARRIVADVEAEREGLAA